jgi:hypothetical protein
MARSLSGTLFQKWPQVCPGAARNFRKTTRFEVFYVFEDRSAAGSVIAAIAVAIPSAMRLL